MLLHIVELALAVLLAGELWGIPCTSSDQRGCCALTC